MASGGGAPFPNLSDALNRLGHQLHADLTDDIYRRDAARHFENHLQCTLNQVRSTKNPLFPGPSRLVPQCGDCAVNTVKKPIRHVFRHQRRIGTELGPTESETTELSAAQGQNSRFVHKVSSKMCLVQRQESRYGKSAARTEVGQKYETSEELGRHNGTQRRHRDKRERSEAKRNRNPSNQPQRPPDYERHRETRELSRSHSQVAVAFTQTDIQRQDTRESSHLTSKRRPQKVEMMAIRAEECDYGRTEQKYSAKWDRDDQMQNTQRPTEPYGYAPDTITDDTLNVDAVSIPEKIEKAKNRIRNCLPNRVEDAIASAPSGHLLYAPVELQAAAESAVKSIDRSVGALERLVLLAPKNSIDKGQLKTIQLMCVFLRQFHTELRSKRDRATKLELVLRMWNVIQTQSANQGQANRTPAQMPPSDASQKPVAPMSLSNADNCNNKRYRTQPKSNGEEPTIKPTNMSPSSVQVDFTAKKEKHQRSR